MSKDVRSRRSFLKATSFSIPKFWQFSTEREFFNSYTDYNSLRPSRSKGRQLHSDS